MKGISELSRFIRFQLSELRATNDHHSFEHLARYFARLRICPNILPSTGPVSAGGDQGRDFETYRTYLQSTPIATSTFTAFATGKKIVFACSLQQDIQKKIKSDVKTICGSDEKIDVVYFFCEVDIPVSKRHDLQQWGKKEYSIELEIFDGQALSEELTDPEIFWIAEEYLHVPSEMYPKHKKEPRKYQEYKQKWIMENSIPASYADFFQIKHGLRNATFNKEHKVDLTKWIERMEVFLKTGYPDNIKRRAIYEICVAALRGQNRLTSKRELVIEYFSKLNDLKEISELKDSVALLIYCSTAHISGHFDIDASLLVEWSIALTRQIDEAVEDAKGFGRLCYLLQIRGHAGFLQYRGGTKPCIYMDEVFYWWFRLMDEVDNAPLFPLENFADVLSVLVKLIGEDERYLELTKRVDKLLSERTSGYVAASKCRDRALAYYEIGKYLFAIKQLHEAKIQWFSAETITGSLMAMLVLSDCYQKLGLELAAKYHAAGAAYIAAFHDDERTRSILPKALFSLANRCYANGEWISFMQLIPIVLGAHNAYSENPLEIGEHEDLQRMLAYLVIVRIVAQRFNSDIAVVLDKTLKEKSMQPYIEIIEKLTDDKGTYCRNATMDELWKTAQEDLNGRPFCDAGEKRSIEWRALGISWLVEFENEFMVTAFAEEFGATLQIILADFATEDILLLPTKVKIIILTTVEKAFKIEEIPSNELAIWRVAFPEEWFQKDEKLDVLRNNVLSVTTTVLAKCTTLSKESFCVKIEKAFKEGLPMKTFAIRPYSELYSHYWNKDSFESIDRKSLDQLEKHRKFLNKEHTELSWIDTPGPGYSWEKAEEVLKNRYEKTIKPIRLTLKLLIKKKKFRNVVQKLKKEGYLDWQILQIIANIACNYRGAEKVSQDVSPERYIVAMTEISTREEREDDSEIPLEIYSEDKIELFKNISLSSTAKGWGLVLHRKTPDFEALKKLLDVRYRNSTDDIEHDDFFNGI